jgi:translation elongation factor EF-Tu-like GTPase
MAWFRRKQDESMDAQELLARAHAAPPPPGTAPSGSAPGFRMTVEDVFAITGRGTVVTGRIEAGRITKGATVSLTRADGTARPVLVKGIEMFRKRTDSAAAGDNVGLLLDGVARDGVARGDLLTG